MLTQQQPLARKTTAWTCVLVAGVVLLASSGRAFAQETERPSFLADVGKRVLFDPTTYAPAIIAYTATKKDWDTSQPFFQHGANEMNARFTVSGLSNDTPVSYQEGNRRILEDALVNLQVSAMSNFAGNVVERMLVERYPEHHKLIRGLGWAERISLASFLTYKLSAKHFEQAQLNQRLAQQWGYVK